MKKFAEFTVKFRYVFMGVFAALLVVSLLLLPKVKANFDISSYLPDDMETRQALNITQNEFGLNSFVNVMLVGVDESKAAEVAEQINSIDNVILSSFDKKEGFKEGNALIKVTVSGGDFADSTQTAVNDIKKFLNDGGYKYYTNGSAIEGSRLQNGIGGEMTLIMVISVIIVVAILLATSRSWFEPVIFLLIVGTAILINLGTNFFMGEISYITKSVAAILQLALAMDYSIVLLHNYDEFASKGEDAKTAAIDALAVSVKPIISSSLTTVAGLVALMFMSFGIGLDIGLVMSKGIILSMLTVFFLMPCLLVLFNRPLRALRHRPLPLGANKLSVGVVKSRFVVPFILIALIIAGAVLQSFNTYSFSEYQPSADRDAIEAVFAPDSTMMVVLPKAETAEDYALQDTLVENIKNVKMKDTVPFKSAQTFNSTVNSVLAEYPNFDGLGSFWQSLIRSEVERQVGELLNGTEHSRIILSFEINKADQAAFDYIDEIKAELNKLYGEGNTFMAGGVMTNYDISKAFGGDLLITNLITVIAILIIIGLTFRSFSLPAVLVLIIQGAIYAAMSISFIMSQPIFFMSYLIASAILMGATIDYAILITDHYLKARKTMDKSGAVAYALKAGIATVLTSGLILTVAGFVVGSFSSSSAISTIGMLLGRGALSSMILVLVLLPQLLYLLDKPIQKTSFGLKLLNGPQTVQPEAIADVHDEQVPVENGQNEKTEE